MGNQVWLCRMMVIAVALAGGGASIGTRAQAYSLGNGYSAAPGGAHEDSSIDSADPTDDGSIVIECVAWGGTRDGERAEKGYALRLASMPQRHLGPTKCWPRAHKPIP
jgi:hypothetical protein